MLSGHAADAGDSSVNRGIAPQTGPPRGLLRAVTVAIVLGVIDSAVIAAEPDESSGPLPGTEAAVGGGGNVAISQRTINSSVVVQSGETVVLGGLILETRNDTKDGIPVLMDLPGIGNLFSTTSEDVFRTELIVMITPRVVVDETAVQAITDELRNKMKRSVDYGNSIEGISF